MGTSARLAAVALPLVAIIAIGLGAPAQASETQLSPSQLSEFRSKMAAAGIDLQTQDKLVVKLVDQGFIDSMTDAAPIREFIEEASDVTRSVKEFADGSRSWTEVEKVAPANSLSRAAITNCSASGAWRVNCRVDISDLVSSAWFVIDYAPSAPSQVRDFRGKGCQILGGSCSVSGGVGRATQNSSGPAWAYLNYNVTTWSWIGASGQFGIRISNGGVSTY